jgi:hypothetical protein
VRTDLAPAQMTATGVRPSSVRSADTSMEACPPLRSTRRAGEGRPQGADARRASPACTWDMRCRRLLVTAAAVPQGWNSTLHRNPQLGAGRHPAGGPPLARCSRGASQWALREADLWTPPMPPVTKMWMPAIAAMIIVADTVVAPSALAATAAAMSRRDTLLTCAPLLAMCSSCSGVRPASAIVSHHTRRRHEQAAPTHSRPEMTAIVAGTAP